jgi:ABC-type Mn2+/Zn2+ transport system ATPase subunit
MSGGPHHDHDHDHHHDYDASHAHGHAPGRGLLRRPGSPVLPRVSFKPAREGLRCENLTICYHQRPAVHHLNVEIPGNAFVGVVGPNGAGKSTLLHGILGWLPWTSGEVWVGGEAVTHCKRRLTYLPQRKHQDLDFPVTVEMVVEQGRFQHLGVLKGFTAADHAAVDAAIAEMGLEKLRQRPLSQLSGGQQQRAFLARALATGADVLLLDEPLTGLDEPSVRDLLTRLRAWADQGRLVIAVIHDIAAVRRYCTHALLLNRDLIACGPVEEALAPAHLTRAYGHDFGDAQL